MDELKKALVEIGREILNPPSSVTDLLLILNQAEHFLSLVDQSPSQTMLTALDPTLNGLTSKKLLGHPNADVRVHVAACICEITRITAPETPYDDNLMKDVFKIIVDSFEKLDDFNDRSFSKRITILDTTAKVKFCVVMLDLKCDALIQAMFSHFLRTISELHRIIVMSSMDSIMRSVIEESEEISPALVSLILQSVEKDSPPIPKLLAEIVIVKCSSKLKPCLISAVRSLGAPLDSFSEIVVSLCQDRSYLVPNLDEQQKGSEKIDKFSSEMKEREKSSNIKARASRIEESAPLPCDRNKESEKVEKLSVSSRTEQTRIENSSIPMNGSDKTSELVANDITLQKIRPKKSAHGRNAHAKDSEKVDGKEVPKTPKFLTDGIKVQRIGPKKSALAGSGRPKDSEVVGKFSNSSSPDQPCVENSFSEVKGREQSQGVLTNDVKALQIMPKKSALIHQKDSEEVGKFASSPMEVKKIEKLPDILTNAIRVHQSWYKKSARRARPKGSEEICKPSNSGGLEKIKGEEKLSGTMLDDIETQESRPKESVHHLHGQPKEIEGVYNSSRPSKTDQTFIHNPLSENKSSDIMIYGIQAQDTEVVDESSRSSKTDHTRIDNSSNEMEGIEKSLVFVTDNLKAVESKPVKPVARHQDHQKITEAVHKALVSSISDHTCIDNSSNEMKRTEKTSVILIDDIEAQESESRLKEPSPHHKGTEAVDKFSDPSRPDQTFIDDSSNKMEGSENLSDMMIDDVKELQSRPKISSNTMIDSIRARRRQSGSKVSEEIEKSSSISKPDKRHIKNPSEMKGKEKQPITTTDDMKDRNCHDRMKGSDEIDKSINSSKPDQTYIDNSSKEMKGIENAVNDDIKAPNHRRSLKGSEQIEKSSNSSDPYNQLKEMRSREISSNSVFDDSRAGVRDGTLKGSEEVIKSSNSNHPDKMRIDESSKEGSEAIEKPSGDNSSEMKGREKSLNSNIDIIKVRDSPLRPKGSKEIDKVGIDDSSREMKGEEKLSDIKAEESNAVSNRSKSISAKRENESSSFGRTDQIHTVESSSETKGKVKSSDVSVSNGKLHHNGPEESSPRLGCLRDKERTLREIIDLSVCLGLPAQNVAGEMNSKGGASSSPKKKRPREEGEASLCCKTRSPQEEGGASSSRQKRKPRGEEREMGYDETLIGAKISVWWPDDKKYYRGVIASYNPATLKHKILYVDGDEEELLLTNEFFKFHKDTGLEGGWTASQRAKLERRPPSSPHKRKLGGHGEASSSQQRRSLRKLSTSVYRSV